jgi:hypothetical protein
MSKYSKWFGKEVSQEEYAPLFGDEDDSNQPKDSAEDGGSLYLAAPRNSAVAWKNDYKATPTKSRWRINWREFPYFIVSVTVIDVIMLSYSIYLNKGFEPWRTNPLLGPKSSILSQLGGKDTALILKVRLDAPLSH